MDIEKELDELLAEVKGVTHPGESIRERAHHSARETFDLVKAIRLATDDTDREDDLEYLIVKIEEFATKAVDALLADRPFVKRTVKAGIPLLVTPLVEKAADYTGSFYEFTAEHVLPVVKEWRITLQSFEAALED